MKEEDKQVKKIYLLCNAHLDPVWLWEWEEGVAETLSTFLPRLFYRNMRLRGVAE